MAKEDKEGFKECNKGKEPQDSQGIIKQIKQRRNKGLRTTFWYYKKKTWVRIWETSHWKWKAKKVKKYKEIK